MLALVIPVIENVNCAVIIKLRNEARLGELDIY